MTNKEKSIFLDPRTEKLTFFCPTGTLSLVDSWLHSRRFVLTITRERVTKVGDFRPATQRSFARISVNNNLHPVEFLITLAHEIAHYEVYKKFQRRRKPHGPEWRNEFRRLLQEMIDTGALSAEVCAAIRTCYFQRDQIAASACVHLKRVLDGTRVIAEERVVDVMAGERFQLKNGREFIRGEKMRTRYRCKEVRSGRTYAVHALAVVVKKDQEDWRS